MYDWPETAWANDTLWRAIAERLNAAGIAAPAALERSPAAEAVWRDPGLVLSQTCGYPYATRLIDKVRLVATPVYGVAGCDGPLYSSAIVVRGDERGGALADFTGRRVAYNASDSLSGYRALIAAMHDASLDPASFAWVETGGHRASVRAVAEGRADMAAIDAVCWALAERHENEAVAQLAAIAWTPLRPALPFITAGGRSDDEVAALRTALSDALVDAEIADARQALALNAVAVLKAEDYAPLAALPG